MTTNKDPYRDFALEGTQANVVLGRLLTPQEFRLDCLHLAQRPPEEAWALQTYMSGSVVRFLRNSLIPSSAAIAMTRSTRGVVYPVLVLQAAGLQVRILLSLAHENTQHWLRDVTATGVIHISLQEPDEKKFSILKMPCKSLTGHEVEGLIGKTSKVDHEEFLLDAARMIWNLAELEALPSLIPHLETKTLKVVAILEDSLGADQEEWVPSAQLLN